MGGAGFRWWTGPSPADGLDGSGRRPNRLLDGQGASVRLGLAQVDEMERARRLDLRSTPSGVAVLGRRGDPTYRAGGSPADSRPSIDGAAAADRIRSPSRRARPLRDPPAGRRTSLWCTL